jgi:hypothetical protein
MFGHFRTVCSRFNPLFTAQLNGTVFAVSKVGDENVRIQLILCTEKFHEDLGIDHASKWLFHHAGSTYFTHDRKNDSCLPHFLAHLNSSQISLKLQAHRP